MITPQTIRRLLQFIGLVLAETVVFAVLDLPWWGRFPIVVLCAVLLFRYWRRADNPKPKHARRRLGPPAEWIDR